MSEQLVKGRLDLKKKGRVIAVYVTSSGTLMYRMTALTSQPFLLLIAVNPVFTGEAMGAVLFQPGWFPRLAFHEAA